MDDPEAGSIIMQLLIIVFLTLVNAFFAGAEMAVVSVNKNKIKRLAESGNKKEVLIQNLSEDSTKFLSTIQVAITFAGFFSSASAATGISKVLGAWMKEYGIPSSDIISMVVVTVILSYLGDILFIVGVSKTVFADFTVEKLLYNLSQVSLPTTNL